MSSEAVLLRTLLLETKDGEWGKDEPFDDSVEMHVIRGTDFETVSQCQLNRVPIRHIAGKAAARKTLSPQDILIETAGGSKGKPTGKTVFLRKELFARSSHPLTCASFARFLRINDEQAEPEFIYWFLQSMYASGAIENYQVQHTGIARFQFTKFADSVTVSLPARDYQIRICELLGRIDDRITLLRETNATLEAIAQALFKSWFVDFDPVRAKMQGRTPEGMDEATAALFPDGLQDLALGLVPKGWATGSLTQISKISSGNRPNSRSDAMTDANSVPLFGGAGIMGFTNEALFQARKILTGRVGTLGKVHIAYPPFWASDNVLVLSPEGDLNFLFCFHWVKSIDVQSLNRGSTQPLLTQKDLGKQLHVIPTKAVLSAFAAIVEVIYESIRENQKQAQTLATLRDTLLPRLISGALRLPEAA